MAQVRYQNYARALVSFDENLRLLGIVHPGRICGFDTMIVQGGNTLRITHPKTGVLPTNLAGAAMTKRGVVQSRQGVFVHEDDYVDVNVDFNGGNASERIDTLVMTHSFIDSPGGAPATYSVVKGATGTPFPSDGPGVSNPLNQVAIGRFVILANAADHTGTIFEPFPPKAIGGNSGGFLTPDDYNVKDVTGGFEKAEFNRVTRPGVYFITSTSNRPTASTSSWFMMVMRKTDIVVQLAMSGDAAKTYTRASLDKGLNWTPWVNLNNPDVEISLAAVITAVGNLNYSSNTYVIDGTSLTTAVGALDAALAAVAASLASANTNINNLQTAVGNLNYLSNHYVVDGQSLTQSIGVLDAAIAWGAWTNLSLASGWGFIGPNAPQYRLSPDGNIVQMRGGAIAAPVSSGTLIVNATADLATAALFDNIDCIAIIGGTPTPVRLTLDSSGQITCIYIGNGQNVGITFSGKFYSKF